MNEAYAFAFDPTGSLLVCTDGPEILVYRDDGIPAYKVFSDGLIVGCDFVQDQLVTVDADGTLRTYRSGDGSLLDERPVSRSATDLSVAPDSTRVLVTTPEAVVIVDPGLEPRALPITSCSVAALGPGGSSVGVGTHGGAFQALDPASGGAWGTVQLGHPIVGVAWSNLGLWAVASGESLYLVRGDGTEVDCKLDLGGQGGVVAISADGLVGAVVVDDSTIIVFDLYHRRPAGTLSLRRKLVGLSFGRLTHLGLGLDDGDGMQVDLLSRQSNRTEPHPGRGRNIWRLTNNIEESVIRAALVYNQAGGAPIAQYIAPVTPEEEEESGSGCLWGCGGGLIMSWIMVMLLGGCAGIGYMGHFTFGWW